MDPAELTKLIEELRATVAELTAKSRTRKEKIEALEAIVAERDQALAASQTQLKRVTIDGPMQAMAESLSVVPALFLEQFNKSYRVELVDGELTILNAEDGKPSGIPFEQKAIFEYLTDENHTQAKTFNAILIGSRASGAASHQTQRIEKKIAKPALSNQFGLR
jgi:hypothetical protein